MVQLFTLINKWTTAPISCVSPYAVYKYYYYRVTALNTFIFVAKFHFKRSFYFAYSSSIFRKTLFLIIIHAWYFQIYYYFTNFMSKECTNFLVFFPPLLIEWSKIHKLRHHFSKGMSSYIFIPLSLRQQFGLSPKDHDLAP